MKPRRPLASKRDSSLFPTEADRRQRDEDRLYRMYAAWRKEQIADLLAGTHGREVGEIRAMLKRMAPDAREPVTGRMLVTHVEAADWAREMPDRDRLVLLQMIGAALRWARAKRGLPVFDDPMPGEPESAFMACKRLLRVR